MFTSSDVALVRHVVQRILVPCVVVIGLLGNSVSIYVLTRKRMRCTTNIYLTALAITDIAYLTMSFLASLQHYDYIRRNSEIYHACFGTVMWLIDAFAYISIYIAVCFTIERFIAIRYPLKRQTFCTESLAKRVIAGVSVFCLLTTVSTAFEHNYRIDTKLIDSHGIPCNLTDLATNTQTATSTLERIPMQHDYAQKTWQQNLNDELEESPIKILKPEQVIEDKKEAFVNSLVVKRNAISLNEEQQALSKATTSNIPSMLSAFYPHDSLDVLLNAEFPDTDVEIRNLSSTNVNVEVSTLSNRAEHYPEFVPFDCANITYYKNIRSDFGKNAVYTNFYSYFTLFIFVIIPLAVLGTFNCFLIMLVRRSKSVRGDLTNASSIRKSTNKRKQNSSSVSQENRVTVTLIAVVLLFIICQLPWAIYLIAVEQIDIEPNLQMIFGNVFNFLAAINAAANFFLYCVLSDKYRKTVRELITGYKYRKQRFNNNIYSHESLYTATPNGMGGNSRRSRPPKSIMKNTTTMSTSSSFVIK